MVSSKALPGFLVALNIGLASPVALAAEPMGLKDDVAREAQALDAKVIAWRRDIHAHPELGNQEQRTSTLVADHLRSLGLEVRTGVARTGVVGILRGGRPRERTWRCAPTWMPCRSRSLKGSPRLQGPQHLSRARGRCHARLRP